MTFDMQFEMMAETQYQMADCSWQTGVNEICPLFMTSLLATVCSIYRWFLCCYVFIAGGKHVLTRLLLNVLARGSKRLAGLETGFT